MRRSSLSRYTRLVRTTRMVKVNIAATVKRKRRQASKAAKARTSEGYKLAMQWAGGRCELTPLGLQRYRNGERNAFRLIEGEGRCTATDGLQGHHTRYGSKYGGGETADMILFTDPRCHDLLEACHPTRRRRG